MHTNNFLHINKQHVVIDSALTDKQVALASSARKTMCTQEDKLLAFNLLVHISFSWISKNKQG